MVAAACCRRRRRMKNQMAPKARPTPRTPPTTPPMMGAFEEGASLLGTLSRRGRPLVLHTQGREGREPNNYIPLVTKSAFTSSLLHFTESRPLIGETDSLVPSPSREQAETTYPFAYQSETACGGSYCPASASYSCFQESEGRSSTPSPWDQTSGSV